MIVLEGGYSLSNLKQCGLSVIKTLLGEVEIEEIQENQDSTSNCWEIIENIKVLIKPYWKFL